VKPRILSLVAALGAFAVFFPGAAHAADVLPPGAVPPAIEQAEGEAAQWLLAQMVPNDIVPAPDPGRRRLLVSYRVPRDDPTYRFVYGRSFVYDDALGAIALTMLGRYRIDAPAADIDPAIGFEVAGDVKRVVVDDRQGEVLSYTVVSRNGKLYVGRQ